MQEGIPYTSRQEVTDEFHYNMIGKKQWKKIIKQNKKFTIGEWVYSQYVDGFKRGNLYYRPVYDKGYNFSRRYLPGSNVSSFNLQQPNPTIDNSQFQQSIENSNQSEFNTFDQLPILE